MARGVGSPAGRPRSTPTPSTCSGRPWSAPGRSTRPRLTGYLEKATREAKRHTTWTEPDEEYDAAVRGFAEAVLADTTVRALVTDFVDRRRHPLPGQRPRPEAARADRSRACPTSTRAASSSTSRWSTPTTGGRSTTQTRRERLAALDAGEAPRDLDDEKLLVVSRALRLRRARPDGFGAGATYAPVETGTPARAGLRTLRRGRDGRVAADRRRQPVTAGATRRCGSPRGSGATSSPVGRTVPRRWSTTCSAELPVALLVRQPPDGGRPAGIPASG